MGFKEELQRYREGTASSEEVEIIEKELEKFQLLEEYAMEQFDEERPEAGGLISESDKNEIKGITKKVNRKLLKATTITFLAAAMLLLLLGPVCSYIFYNPNRGYNESYGGDGQFFIDAAVFTELHSPGYTTNWAKAVPGFPGSYHVEIRQSNVFRGSEENFSGRIVRGKMAGSEASMTGFYPNIVNRAGSVLETYWHFPPINGFGRKLGIFCSVDYKGNDVYLQPQEEIDSQLGQLEQLPSSSWAAAYITFGEDLSLDTFSSLYRKWVLDQGDLDITYAAVRCSEPGDNMNVTGFEPGGTGVLSEAGVFPEETYPLLRPTIARETEDGKNLADNWKQHFTSMLQYMADRPQFLKAMADVNGISTDYYEKLASYVEDHGIQVFGVMIQGNVSQVISFARQEGVDGLYVEDAKLSALSR